MIFRQDVKSPVAQSMMYMAEYADGSHRSEYDLQTGNNTNFNKLDKNGILRFGIVGIDVPLYLETYGGFFHIAGRNIQVKYVENDVEYYLIGQPKFYDGLLYYKTGLAELPMTPKAEYVAWGKPEGEIVSYHFGYKDKLEIEDTMFTIHAECTVPFQEPVKLNFALYADKEMKGKFVIIRNGVEVFSDDAPLDPKTGGSVEWTVI
ncbi:hypothetical protein [Metabacillus fastidiosus]|uniref:hypothetical protein n=1 Tax=Metabacillus fastidiosus TaxID=1458 RepID=UPI003D2D9EB3